MGNFLAELKRRHIYRVAAAYAVVAWVLIQLVGNVTPMLRLPEWAGSLVLVLLVVGFPVVLIFGWVHQLQPATTDGPLGRAPSGGHDWLLIGALAAVIAIFAYQQFAPVSGSRTASEQASGVTVAREAAASPKGAISLAVLPFANMSGDTSQDFFSDGMTEEITAALAKVPDLRVVARTSAFEFKGKNVNIKTMGQELGATHVIEGSVRKVGDRARITVQLINAADGTHIWSENYDRQLTDIFAIQEDIARAITTSLRMPLGLKPGENLVNNRSIDPESYQQYLRAKALYRARGLANVNSAVALLDQVVARDPGYAPAWAQLASAYNTLPNYSALLPNASVPLEEVRRAVQSSQANAEPAARKAIQLDPNLTDGYVALAGLRDRAGKFLQAEELYLKALALDPSNTDALGYARLLIAVGRVKEGLAMRQQSHALEPFVPVNNRNLAVALWLNGEDDAALAIFKALNQNRNIAMVHAGAGRFNEAADTLLSAPSESYRADALKDTVRLLRMAPKTVAAAENPAALGELDFVYLFVGAPQRVLDYYERNVAAGWMVNAQTDLLWHPSYAPARKTERFKALVRKAGMVEYWRAKGWPEFCHPLGADDFACE